MKTIIVFLVSLLVVLSSCENQDDMVINNLIKSELAALPSPEKQEFTDVINSNYSTSKLKSASTQISLVEVFALNEETFEVYDDYAVKKFVYYEISNQGERVELLTMQQQFQIIDGKLDTSGYSIEYEIGCDESKNFEIQSGNFDIWEVTCAFHFDNGSQFAYRIMEGYLHNVKLPNIANGKWQLSVETNDEDMDRRLTTGYINFEQDNTLYLMTQPKQVNVVAKLVIPKHLLEDVYMLRVSNEGPENGNDVFFYMPVVYNDNMAEEISFDLPFLPEYIQLMSENSPWLFFSDGDCKVVFGNVPIYFIQH